MPKLLRSSETIGCGATIELNSGEVISVSIAQSGVLVTLAWHKRDGLLKKLFGRGFFGRTLYNESHTYRNAGTALTLRVTYPEQVADLHFKNPVLAAFSNAVWHCATAAEVCIVLNEAASKSSEPKDAAAMATLYGAYQVAQNWSPPRLLPEKTPATYNVVYSDGVNQETRLTPAEIDRWANESNKADVSKPYRIVRIVDQQGHVVWGK
jgi:hypothetical protein